MSRTMFQVLRTHPAGAPVATAERAEALIASRRAGDSDGVTYTIRIIPVEEPRPTRVLEEAEAVLAAFAPAAQPVEWECPHCRDTREVTQNDIAEVGIPMCGNCDEVMGLK